MNQPDFENTSCPMPLPHNSQIVMGHGSGGKMSHQLIKTVFLPHLQSEPLLQNNDFAKIILPDMQSTHGRLIVSTDAHIVTPLFFPGGDIGRLAVCGTVNDVAMSGARPLYLTASFIIEEGMAFEQLGNIAKSMQGAAAEAGVFFIAGDTKVVEKNKGDGLFISTTGIGWLSSDIQIGGQYASPGDVVIISGTIGDHGMAILSARGDLGLETSLLSDVAPLNHLINVVLQAAPHTHVLRDPTRGGLGTTLNEIAQQSNVGIHISENDIPILPAVKSICELLGFDPLYVANEGKVIVIVPEIEAGAALKAMHNHPYGKNAAVIGKVVSKPEKTVLLGTSIGGTRIVDMLSGEMLPRIC